MVRPAVNNHLCNANMPLSIILATGGVQLLSLLFLYTSM